MGLNASTPCVVCQGTGTVSTAPEYPDLVTQQWCLSCESGRAKAELVAELVRCTLTAKRPVAA